MTNSEQIKFIERYNDLWNKLRDERNCAHYSMMQKVWDNFTAKNS